MQPEQQNIVNQIAREVQQVSEGEGSGHDWWHVVRVWNMAKRIAEGEHADGFTVELAALLHDVADWKFHDGDETVGSQVARRMLAAHDVEDAVIEQVCNIIRTLSFKGAEEETPMRTIEGKVVQDADRLDAIGAIGIARAFAYGGYKHRPMHDPATKPSLHQSKQEYMSGNGSTVHHFYEKLFLLKDRMNTQTAKELAEGRHLFMQEYLDRFFQEWEGKL